MEAKEKAKKLFESISFIARYSSENKATKMIVNEIVEAIKENNDKKYWEEVNKEIHKL